MKENNENDETAQRLLTITREDWKIILGKCYSHIEIKLFDRTKWGAHCEQRLGMPAQDFYTGEAIKGLYSFKWKWKFSQYTLQEQLIRIIDSLISKEVKKYRSEQRRGKQTQLKEPHQIHTLFESTEDDYTEPVNLEKFSVALQSVCTEDSIYDQFIHLKKEHCSYDEISKRLGLDKKETYRLRETIARKAAQKLKSL